MFGVSDCDLFGCAVAEIRLIFCQDQLTYKTQTNPARAVLEQVQVFEIPLANSLTMVADHSRKKYSEVRASLSFHVS